MCPECPFARSTPKAYLDTRGQNGERFVGQAHLNALLPCHMEGGGRAEVDGSCKQCAGAAKFRANLGGRRLVEAMGVASAALGKLPPDREAVFADEAELLAHHEGIGVEEARRRAGDPAEVGRMVLEEQLAAARRGAFVKP